MNRFLSVLLLIGLVFSGLNPLCKNSSTAKMLIEICSPDGIKTVEIDANGAPEDSNKKPASTSQKNCHFCFAAHMAKFVPDAPPLKAGLTVSYNIGPVFSESLIVSLARAERYDARAPPTLLT